VYQQRHQVDLLTWILAILVRFWPVVTMVIVAVLLDIAWWWGLLGGLTIYALFFWGSSRVQQQRQQQIQLQQQQQQLKQQGLPRSDAKAKPARIRTAEEILADFSANFIGMRSVKDKMHEIVKVIEANQRRRAEGLPVTEHTYHMIFTGNPGTGKTVAARTLAELFAALRVFGNEPKFIETDRSGLIAGYVGQTEARVNYFVNAALGGVLFVDEAYALTPRHESDFGHQAIATLIKRLEDDRDKFCCVLAGYTREMNDFLKTNPGLESRIAFTVEFPDYSLEELIKIAQLQLAQCGYGYDENVLLAIKRYILIAATGDEPLQEEMADLYACRKGITLPGNARDIRKIVQAGIRAANVAGRYTHVLPSDFHVNIQELRRKLLDRKRYS